MLKRLSLQDFVIVASLDVEFDAGFAALTGETGAGKSILIDALQLALGNRADAGVVREGAPRADISAWFEPPHALATALGPWLEAAGFELDTTDGPGGLLLRRTVDAAGKSRAWINGSPATITQLRELGERLVEIHGQHAWQSLTRPEAVRDLLDAHAGADTRAMQAAWKTWRAAQQKLDEASARQADLDSERERLRWQIGELDKLAPGAGEWEELNTEHRRLSHAQGILDAAQQALGAVSDADDSADALTSRAIEALEPVADVEPALADALAVLRSAQAQLQDAAHSLGSALRRTELDPQRLAELDERLASWLGLARRYRRQPEELPATLAAWLQELQALDDAADLEALQREVARTRAACEAEARKLTQARGAAAPKLAREVTALLQTLGMAGARFDVQLRALGEPQSWGAEQIEFLVAGHAGSTPRPLGKVASGGELSRIALAIAVCAHARRSQSGAAAAATLIFDEIDAGIGGAVGDTVGRLMQQLGGEVQVLAVTHLPQVAACADRHFVVSKAVAAGQTLSRVDLLDDTRRAAELARMLSGEGTEAALNHAREMLAAGRRSTRPRHTAAVQP